MSIKIADLLEELGGTLEKSELTLEVSGVETLENASSDQLSFFTSDAYKEQARTTKACVILVSKLQEDLEVPQWVHENPYWAFAKVSQKFAPEPSAEMGVHDLAYVDTSAIIGKNVSIGPFVHVEEGAIIGDNVILRSHVYVGKNAYVGSGTEVRSGVKIEFDCKVGENCLIHANTVIGADGFGFAPGKDGLAKIPQVGNVEIGNNVEIGAVCSIDRAAFGSTKIGDGSKLDSKVHIGHNAELGKNNILCGLVGVAGSSKLGDWVVLGGNACVSNHMQIGSNIRVGAKAGVTHPLSEPGDYMGFPAIPAKDWRRMVAGSRRIGKMDKRIRELEKKCVTP